jgi:5-methylcytosine-specific restriction enzyme subunit McrC
VAGLSPDVLAGKGEAGSLLFDMNKLFESWLAAKLRPEAIKQGCKLREQSPKKYLAERVDLAKPVFQMRPDIAFINSQGRAVFIADAKWKLLDAQDAKLGISQPDLYQLNAYANNYGVTKLALYYPAQKGLEANYTLRLDGIHKCDIEVHTVEIM